MYSSVAALVTVIVAVPDVVLDITVNTFPPIPAVAILLFDVFTLNVPPDVFVVISTSTWFGYVNVPLVLASVTVPFLATYVAAVLLGTAFGAYPVPVLRLYHFPSAFSKYVADGVGNIPSPLNVVLAVRVILLR